MVCGWVQSSNQIVKHTLSVAMYFLSCNQGKNVSESWAEVAQLGDVNMLLYFHTLFPAWHVHI